MKMNRIFWVGGWMLLALSTQASLSTDIDKMINTVSPAMNIGIEVFDLTTGTTLYRRNAERTFIPASNMKLFSDAAALLALGPTYRFKTQLSTSARQLTDGVLQGSLHLNLNGDPSFDQAKLNQLLMSLKQWSVHTITGNIYIDSSHAGVSPYPPGWVAEDFKHSYGAPIAPLVLDTNRLTVTINPGSQYDKPAIIETSDTSNSIQINNHVVTKPADSQCSVGITVDTNNQLTAQGCVAMGQWAVQQIVPIRNPLLYAQNLIKQQLEQMNIRFSGEILLGNTPPGALLLATTMSEPLSQLMADTLKPSDNLYADSLYLHTARLLQGSPVNWDTAQPVIKNFIQNQLGIPLQQAAFVDGSGLSRHDLLTPQQTVTLLRFLYTKFPLAYEYIAALPISGQDGTLQKRFTKPNQRGLIRAKTGTMKGVVSLSGYLYTANAHVLAFSIFINHLPKLKPGVTGRYRPLIDEICSYFLRQTLIGNAEAIKPIAQTTTAVNHTPLQSINLLKKQRQSNYFQWRKLETALKSALKGQAVTVIYRYHELILQDYQPDNKHVLKVLHNLNKQHRFSMAVATKKLPDHIDKHQPILWIKKASLHGKMHRTWTLRDAVT